jgi:lysophospholipase L1-like esterase
MTPHLRRRRPWLAGVGLTLLASIAPGTNAIEPVFSSISKPFFNPSGTLRYIASSVDGLYLVECALDNPAVKTSRLILAGPGLGLPELGVDPSGGFWISAEERMPEKTSLAFGPAAGPITPLNAGSGGSDFGAEICLDAAGRPWVAWLHGAGRIESLLIRDVFTGRTWRLSGPSDSALSPPRVFPGLDGELWAVWSGKDRMGYAVFARRFDGLVWARPQRIAQTGRFPCLRPDAVVDASGRIWIAWSAYDGEDYEIYLADGGDAGWSAPRPFTANEGAEDEFPSLSLLDGIEPVVSWTRLNSRGATLLSAIFEGLSPREPVVHGIEREGLPVLKTASDAGRIAVLWTTFAGEVAVRVLRREDLLGTSFAGRATSVPAPLSVRQATGLIFNPALNESGYVCFGDSITYGHLAGENAPQKGYVPRLDTMLDTAFGPQNVTNDGAPGEFTSQGLARIDSVLAGRKSRYILIMEGTNDVKEVQISIETSIFNLREMIRKSLAYGAFPAIATVIPRRDWIWFYQEYKDRHNALLAGVRKAAADYKIPLVDLHQDFLDYPGGPDAVLDTDGKHPNEKGYQLMAERWFAALGKYPFPAAEVQVAKKYDKLLFYRLSGNMLSWEACPKITAPATIQGYKIYRRKPGEGLDKFRLLLQAGDIRSYFDTDIQGTDLYEYILVTVRMDGIEGPCSTVVKSR